MSGGASGASFPVAGDAVTFDSNSGNAAMTVNVASACASLVVSGTYAGTLTFNDVLTLTSTCTFISGMTIAGTAGTLACTATATLTSGGKTLTCALTLNGTSPTFTLADDWTVNGLATVGANSTVTVNGASRTLTCAGGLTHPGTSGVVGTAKLKITGGTLQTTSTAAIRSNIDLAGNVTISGTFRCDTNTLRYLSGTITTTGSTLTVANTGITLDTHGVTWNDVTFGVTATYTLTSDLEWSGTLAFSNVATTAGAGKFNGTGAVTFGTTSITLGNTGGLVTTGTMTLPNTAMTFAGTAGFSVGTLTNTTYTSSRIVTLTFGNTYTVTTALSNVGTSSTIRQAIKSSSAGNKVVFTLNPGATTTLAFCDPTDVDSSAGATVVSVGGTITTSLNWTGSVTAGSSVPRFGLRGLLFFGNEATMDVPLDEVMYVEGIASSSTGAAADADSTPTFAVYEEATDTDIGVGGNMTKRTSLTGDYRASFTASAANGFELGKWYVAIGSATIGGIAAKAILGRWRIVAAENTQGYPLVDVSKVNNTAQTAGDLAALLNSLVSATGAGDLTTKTADSATLTTGSTISGAYTDTSTDNDVFWITAPVTPAVGGFGLRQQFVFNLALGRVPVSIYLRGWFNGTGRSADLYALNARTGVYDKLTNTTTNLASRTTELAYAVTLPRDYGDSSGGANNIVTLELRSTSTTTADRLRVDQLLVTHVAESSPTTLVAPTTADIWSFANRTLTTPGVEPATAPTTAQITAALWTDLLASSDFSTASSIGKLLKDNIDAAVSSRLAPTTAGRTLDVATTGEAGLDFDNIKDATGAHTLTNIRVPNVTLTDTVTTYTGNTPQTGDAYARVGAAGAGLTALGDTRIANLDATVSSRLASASYTAPPSAASIVTTAWTDLLSGSDFATAGSIGKLLKDDIDAAISSRSSYAGTDTAGTTTLLARLTAGRGTNLDNLDAAVSSRMATYTQPTGFLAATFPATVASTTNITGGTITTVTTLTNLPAAPTDWLTAAAVKADAVTKIQSGLSTYAGGDTSGTTTLLTRVTAAVALASQIPANFTSALFASAGVFSVGALANAPGLDAASVRAAVGLASANLDTQLGAIAGYVDTEVAAIKAKTDNLPSSFPTNFSSMAVTAAGGVTLADGVAHGGTPGSSTATLALQHVRVNNADGTAVTFQASGNSSAMYIEQSNGGVALDIEAFGGVGIGKAVVLYGDYYGVQIQADCGLNIQANQGAQTHAGRLSAVILECVDGGEDAVKISTPAGHDINLTGDGRIWDGINARPVSVTLADGVAHGGTPGLSTATMAFSRMVGQSQTEGAAAFSMAGNGSGAGALFTGGASGGSGFICQGSSVFPDGPYGDGARFLGGYPGGHGARMFGGASGGNNVTGGNGLFLLGGDAGTSPNDQAGNGFFVAGGDGAASANVGGRGVLILAGTDFGAGAASAVVIRDSDGNAALTVADAGGDVLRAVAVGGHALSLLANGADKHDVNLAGSGDIWDGVNNRPVQVLSDRVMFSGVLGDQSLGDVDHVVLPSGPASNGVLAGSRIRFTAGAGQDQERTIADWDGTNKIAGIDQTLNGTVPTAGDAFQVLYDNAARLDGGNVLATAHVSSIGPVALGQFFNLDSGETYASAVPGSVVKEVVTSSVSGGLDAAGVRAAVGLASANLDTQLSTIAGYVDTEVAAIKAKTDLIPAGGFPANFSSFALTVGGAVTVGTNNDKTGYGVDAAGVRAAVGLASANLDAQLSANPDTAGTTTLLARLTAVRATALDDLDIIKAKTDQLTFTAANQVDSAAVSVGDKTGYKLAADGVDDIQTESGLNLRQATTINTAVLAGKLSGAETTTVTILGAGTDITRVVATVDANGNRLAVTVIPPT